MADSKSHSVEAMIGGSFHHLGFAFRRVSTKNVPVLQLNFTGLHAFILMSLWNVIRKL